MRDPPSTDAMLLFVARLTSSSTPPAREQPPASEQPPACEQPPASEERRAGVWFSTAQSTLYPEHAHAGTEYNLVLAGELHYGVAGREVRARAGQLLVLPAGEPHVLLRTSEDVALWVVEWPRPRGVADGALRGELTVGTPAPELRKALQRLLRQLWLRPAAARALQLEAELESCLASADLAPQPPAMELHPAVVRARALCEQPGANWEDVESLARAAGISPSRLSHLFTEQLGLAPSQYKNFAQVQSFIQSSERNGSSLLRAALEAGFGSYAQFHRVFYQVCGVSPARHLDALHMSPLLDPRVTLGAPERASA